jgi:hypothetical protein
MRGAGIISVVLVLIIACSNANEQKINVKNDSFNAWEILSDANFLLHWEKATLKSIDSITPILINEAKYSQKTIKTIKEEVINSKGERIIKGRKVYGSHKWLLNKFAEYKDILDTTACNSMFVVESSKEGEVTESINWLVLFLNDDCRMVLTVENGSVKNQNKLINKQALEKLIKENYPSALMTNKCLDNGEGLPMADICISKFTKNSTEVFPFPTFCTGFYEKFLSVMQE